MFELPAQSAEAEGLWFEMSLFAVRFLTRDQYCRLLVLFVWILEVLKGLSAHLNPAVLAQYSHECRAGPDQQVP